MINSDIESKVRRLIDAYSRGAYSVVEISSQIIELATAQNATDLLALLPNEVTQYVKRAVDKAPRTDSEWNTAILLHIRPGNPIRGQECRAEQSELTAAGSQNNNAHYRTKVETIRKFFDKAAT
jgi:hypothetical protein